MTSISPCPRCTQLLPATAAFCRRCGLDFHRLSARATQPRLPIQQPKYPRVVWPAFVLVCFAGLIVVVLLAGNLGRHVMTAPGQTTAIDSTTESTPVATDVQQAPVIRMRAPEAQSFPSMPRMPTIVIPSPPMVSFPRYKMPSRNGIDRGSGNEYREYGRH